MTNEIPLPEEDYTTAETGVPPVNSLREVIDRVSGRGFHPAQATSDSGVAEVLPFPFLALVGQSEMKLALILTLVNPAVGGVLLIGPRGTGKTTAVRSLTDLLPDEARSVAIRPRVRRAAHCRECGKPLSTAAEKKRSRCRDCPASYDEELFERLRIRRIACKMFKICRLHR